MGEVNVSQASILAAIVIANIAGIIGAYVSVKVSIAVLTEKVAYLNDWIKTHNKNQKEE